MSDIVERLNARTGKKLPNPCNFYKHLYDTDYPQGCCVCLWSHEEIKNAYLNDKNIERLRR